MIGRFEEKLLWEVVHAGRGATTTEIYEALQKKYGQVAPGAIYTGLHRMVDKKLVTFKKGPPLPERGGKARNLYSITAAGRAALQDVQQAASLLEQATVFEPAGRRT